MTVYGDMAQPPDATLYTQGVNLATFRQIDTAPGLLSAVAFWLDAQGAAPTGVPENDQQRLRALLYDGDSRALVAVSDEVSVYAGDPLRVVTFPVPGGIRWKGGRLLIGLWGGPNGGRARFVGVETEVHYLSNSNFRNPTAYATGWTTQTPGTGTSTLADIAEPLLDGGGVKVTLAGVTGSGTWRPVRTDEVHAEATVGQSLAEDLPGPSTRVIGFRATVIVDTAVTNAAAPLRLMLRGARIGFTLTPVLDAEVLVAQSPSNLSDYAAGAVIELVGTGVVPDTSTFGVGLGLAVDVTAGAAGALRVGKLDLIFPLNDDDSVPAWRTGNDTGYMWLGTPYNSRVAGGLVSGMAYSIPANTSGLGGPFAARPAGFLTTSALVSAPDLPDEELAARGWYSAQAALAGPVVPKTRLAVSVEWHHTAVDDHEGAFALVREGGPLEEMVGDVLLVSYGGRAVYAYVVDASDEMDADLSLARRAFLGLANLATDEQQMTMEVVAGAEAR
jgi:hypothetical protein